jgi:predicted site-specific integrase-resolvase
LIINNDIDKIIITNKDRLLRFGTELIINIAKKFNTELIIVDKKEDDFNTLLVNDVLEIITVFSAKLYGKRSHKNFNSIKS